MNVSGIILGSACVALFVALGALYSARIIERAGRKFEHGNRPFAEFTMILVAAVVVFAGVLGLLALFTTFF